MTEGTMRSGDGNGWRLARWGAGAGLLLVPAVAMRFTSEVNWGPEDFIVMGGMIVLALGAYELLATKAGNAAYRIASALAVLGAFLLVWINLAVGIIGDEGNPANLMYFGVLAILTGGAAFAKGRAAAMARTLFAVAGAQMLIAAVAVLGHMGSEGPIWPRDILGVTAILSGIALLSGALFRHSSR
ncbi:MAG: hypothetical protein KF730_10735 [Sphingomonas sp.]|uniref:hypothetical protein n=1 Tax=Sphingomonas sp. TaxID=28214 RepID=UPI0025DBF6EA|nr:hypothetical protein [Sphingomonas sp.]MBX3565038.1 hypothetical protein [Sphingomonas sp.]